MNKIITQNWERITKAEARKRYNARQDVYFLSCNMHPENMWQAPCPILRDVDDDVTSFNSTVNNYRYYNCDRQRGMYVAYYIRRDNA